jgi:hypothetical protein
MPNRANGWLKRIVAPANIKDGTTRLFAGPGMTRQAPRAFERPGRAFREYGDPIRKGVRYQDRHTYADADGPRSGAVGAHESEMIVERMAEAPDQLSGLLPIQDTLRDRPTPKPL